MCVRIGLDMGIFTTLTERNEPVSLDELAAVTNARPLLAGRFSLLSIVCIKVIDNETRG